MGLFKIINKVTEVILWDFIIKLLKLKDPITGQEYNSIFIIVNKFTKQGYFITYIKEVLVKNIVQVYIKKVFTKYRVLNKIILNKDIRFILVFQQVFIVE